MDVSASDNYGTTKLRIRNGKILTEVTTKRNCGGTKCCFLAFAAERFLAYAAWVGSVQGNITFKHEY